MKYLKLFEATRRSRYNSRWDSSYNTGKSKSTQEILIDDEEVVDNEINNDLDPFGEEDWDEVDLQELNTESIKLKDEDYKYIKGMLKSDLRYLIKDIKDRQKLPDRYKTKIRTETFGPYPYTDKNRDKIIGKRKNYFDKYILFYIYITKNNREERYDFLLTPRKRTLEMNEEVYVNYDYENMLPGEVYEFSNYGLYLIDGFDDRLLPICESSSYNIMKERLEDFIKDESKNKLRKFLKLEKFEFNDDDFDFEEEDENKNFEYVKTSSTFHNYNIYLSLKETKNGNLKLFDGVWTNGWRIEDFKSLTETELNIVKKKNIHINYYKNGGWVNETYNKFIKKYPEFEII